MEKTFTVLWLGLTLLVIAGPVEAHKEHKKKSSKPAVQKQATKPAPSPSVKTPGPSMPAPSQEQLEQEEEAFVFDWREALLEHLHNKIIHFPLALGLVAALMLLLSYRWSQYETGARLALILAALAAVAAYFTGQAQEEAFEGSELESILKLHETLGTVSAISLWAGLIFLYSAPFRRWRWLWAVAIIVLLSVTGFLGGVLAHA